MEMWSHGVEDPNCPMKTCDGDGWFIIHYNHHQSDERTSFNQRNTDSLADDFGTCMDFQASHDVMCHSSSRSKCICFYIQYKECVNECMHGAQ